MNPLKQKMLEALADLQTTAINRTHDTEILVSIRKVRECAKALLSEADLAEVSDVSTLPELLTQQMTALRGQLGEALNGNSPDITLRWISEGCESLAGRLRRFLQVRQVINEDFDGQHPRLHGLEGLKKAV